MGAKMKCCTGCCSACALIIALFPWWGYKFVQWQGRHWGPAWINRHNGEASVFVTNTSGMAGFGFYSQRQSDRISNGEHEFRPDDVWVETYTKSGTTWTLYIVAKLFGLAIPKAGPFGVTEVCQWIENSNYVNRFENDFDKIKAQKGPRCFKSHWKYHLHMVPVLEKSKVIWVVRNVFDVARSYYNNFLYFVVAYEWTKTFDEWLTYFLAGDVDTGDYFEFIASWWPHKDHKNVLFLRYEDMVQDHEKAIRQIAEFTGTQLTPEAFAKVKLETSKEHMKNFELNDDKTKFLRMMGWIAEHDFVGNTRPRPVIPEYRRAQFVERYEEVLAPLGVPRDWIIPEDRFAA